MQKHGYINDCEVIDDHRSNKIIVELNGRLNKCGVISPHFDVSEGDIEQIPIALYHHVSLGLIAWLLFVIGNLEGVKISKSLVIRRLYYIAFMT